MRGWRDAFPDGKMEIVLMLAEDDLVTAVWTATGTNTGQGNGLPATGKKIEIAGHHSVAHRGWKDSRGMERI
jgi:predicted ester cyclase